MDIMSGNKLDFNLSAAPMFDYAPLDRFSNSAIYAQMKLYFLPQIKYHMNSVLENFSSNWSKITINMYLTLKSIVKYLPPKNCRYLCSN